MEQLARRQGDFVAGAAARLPSRADAEDVVQRAMERATRSIDQLDDDARLESWFWTILRRSLADELASRSRHVARIERFAALAPDPPEEIEIDDGVCKCGVEEFEKLSPALRDVMLKVDVNEMTAAEAARELGIAPGTARVRVHRARKELRARVEDRCQVETIHQCLECAC
jgi:RNA polymerase sigma-70 factor (ECF subfamily)